MGDKSKELEERMDKLENRLKATFLEIEKRFEQIKSEEPAHMTVEDRIQELEDLLLLMQLDVTKLREKVGGGLDFGTAFTPDIEERMHKVEEAMASDTASVAHPKLQQLEAKIAMLEGTKQRPYDFEGKIKTAMSEELDEIESRLKKLEEERELPTKSVLEDVRKILSA